MSSGGSRTIATGASKSSPAPKGCSALTQSIRLAARAGTVGQRCQGARRTCAGRRGTPLAAAGDPASRGRRGTADTAGGDRRGGANAAAAAHGAVNAARSGTAARRSTASAPRGADPAPRGGASASATTELSGASPPTATPPQRRAAARPDAIGELTLPGVPGAYAAQRPTFARVATTAAITSACATARAAHAGPPPPAPRVLQRRLDPTALALSRRARWPGNRATRVELSLDQVIEAAVVESFSRAGYQRIPLVIPIGIPVAARSVPVCLRGEASRSHKREWHLAPTSESDATPAKPPRRPAPWRGCRRAARRSSRRGRAP